MGNQSSSQHMGGVVGGGPSSSSMLGGHTMPTTSSGMMANQQHPPSSPTHQAAALSDGNVVPMTRSGKVVSWVSDTVNANPYFQAGAGLYTLTLAAVVGRYGYMIAASALKRKFVVSMEMTNRDPSYNWVMQWMSRHPSFSFQQLSVITSNVTIHANEETTSQCTFAPCPNVPHWLIHKGWPVMVFRKRQVERAAGSDVLEILELSTLGRGKDLMLDIVSAAQKEAVDRDSDRTVIYQNAGGRWMRNQDPRSRRPLDSVVLDGMMREKLVDDVKLFLNSHKYYSRLGVPYRRGYLLHGPPGCGKSSLVMALAGELRLAICLLSLSNRSLDDESLNTLLNTAPLRSIVLLEDIDRAFAHESRVTMSGVLNALDGVAAQEGRLVVMTTNHVERLDAALIRPGRADMKLEVGLLSQHQARQIFHKFYPAASKELMDEFAAELPDRSVSVAQIQSHLFLYRESPQLAIHNLPSFLDTVLEFEQKIEKARELDKKVRGIKPPPFIHEM